MLLQLDHLAASCSGTTWCSPAAIHGDPTWNYGCAQPESWWLPALASAVAPDAHSGNSRDDLESGPRCTARAADGVVIIDEAGRASVLEQGTVARILEVSRISSGGSTSKKEVVLQKIASVFLKNSLFPLQPEPWVLQNK